MEHKKVGGGGGPPLLESAVWNCDKDNEAIKNI